MWQFRDAVLKMQFVNSLSGILGDGLIVYRGCFDDRRNTDNAWVRLENMRYQY